MKILIVYLATGPYNEYFDGFYESLNKFCPNTEKIVWIVTDNPSYYFKFRGNCYTSYVRNYPWPIVTLFKFHYIKEAYERLIKMGVNDITHVCYFNSNIKFLNEIKPEEFLTDKIIAFPHWNILHYNLTKEDISKMANKNKDSVCYIKNQSEYYQAGMWCCPIQHFNELIVDVTNLIDTDLKHNQIPTWHDESAYNKALIDMIDRSKWTTVGKDFIGCNDEVWTVDYNKTKMTLRSVDRKITDRKCDIQKS